jgi:hypothetical protein
MTKYDELEKLQKSARAAFAAWEAEMVDFSTKFLGALRGALGWPETSFARLDRQPHEVPHGGRLGPGGYTDNEGYHFAVRISVTHAWLQVVFTAKKNDAGTFDIKIGDESFSAIDLREVGSLRAIVEDVTATMRKLVLAAEFHELTRFSADAAAQEAETAVEPAASKA